MAKSNLKFVFFGSSRLSAYILEELEKFNLKPILNITDARGELPMAKLRELNADVFVVAFFGKILPAELIYMPKYKTLNVHPSLLPRLRGPAPIQNMIVENEEPGVTIIRMDEKMDNGPILAQEKVAIEPWPDHYAIVEEKIDRAGGRLLAQILPDWVEGKVTELPQDQTQATYTKLIKKENGLLDLNDPAEINLRKVLAYSTWPGAYFMFKKKNGEEIRIVVKDAKIVDGKPARPDDSGRSGRFLPTRVIPAGKREMDWQDFLRGNA